MKKDDSRKQMIKFCIEEIEKYPFRLGESIYYRIFRNNKYEMLNIDSQDFYNFMQFYLFTEKEFELTPNLWRTAIGVIKGKYGYVNEEGAEVRMELEQSIHFCRWTEMNLLGNYELTEENIVKVEKQKNGNVKITFIDSGYDDGQYENMLEITISKDLNSSLLIFGCPAGR